MMCFTIFFNVFVISQYRFRLNRNALCSIHFNGRVRGKLTDVCNDASEYVTSVRNALGGNDSI